MKNLLFIAFLFLNLTYLKGQCPTYTTMAANSWYVCAFGGTNNYSTNYVGYYTTTDNSLTTPGGGWAAGYTAGAGDIEFNTFNHGWTNGVPNAAFGSPGAGSPAGFVTTGSTGIILSNNDFSIQARRKGFPCAKYRLLVQWYDDAISQVRIDQDGNGTWDITFGSGAFPCAPPVNACQGYPTATTGSNAAAGFYMGPNTRVEIQGYDTVNDFYNSLVFDKVADTDLAVSNGTGTICSGLNATMAPSNGVSPYTYSWTNTTGGSFSQITSNTTIITNNTASAITPTLTATDASGCTASSTLAIAPAGPTSATITNACVGSNTIRLSYTGSGNAYDYNIASPLFVTPLTGTVTTSPMTITLPSVVSASAGSYATTVTYTQSSCTKIFNPTITVVAPPSVTITGSPCTSSVLTATPAAMTSYRWSLTSTPATSLGTTQTYTPTAAGSYTVTVTNSSGCTGTAIQVVSTAPTLTITPATVTVCNSNTTLPIGMTGITVGTYNINISSSPAITGFPFSVNNVPMPATSFTYNVTLPSNLASGSYTISVTLTNPITPCSTTRTMTLVKRIVTPTINPASPVIGCSGSAILTAGGGGTYAWSGGGTASTKSATTPGTYTVTVTNGGCSNIASVTVTSNTTTSTVNINPTNPEITCTNPSVILTASSSGSVSYAWSGGNNPSSATNTITTSGTYTVTVTNTSSGCSAMSSIAINGSSTAPNINITNIGSLSCNSSTVSLTANVSNLPSSSLNYAWSGGNNPNVATNTVTTAGTYTVTVTNTINGCSSTQSTTLVGDYTPPTANAGADVTLTCNNPSTILSANGGVAYNWSNGATQGGTVNPSTTTLYTVTVTGANNCTATDNIVVTVSNTPPSISPIPNAVLTCSNPMATLIGNAIGANSYLWSNGVQATSITVSNSGNYTLTATGINGCTASTTVSVTEDKILPSVNFFSNSPLCANSTLYLNASGGVNYQWAGPNGFTLSNSSGNATINNVSNSNTGTYFVTVTAANGCSNTSSTTVSVNNTAANAVTANSNSPLCDGNILSLQASNGGLSYQWTGPNGFSSFLQNPTIPNITSANIGFYTVSVTLANGCVSVGQTSVIVNNFSNASVVSNTPCIGGVLQLNASGGSNYLWSGPNGFTSSNANPILNNVTGAAAGTYLVTIFNSGCFKTIATTVNINPLPIANLTSNSPICENSALNINGSGTYTYSWTGPNNFVSNQKNISIPNATLNNNGVYTAIISSTFGCSITQQTTIVVGALPSPSIFNNTPCNNGTLNLSASGGTTYSWTGPNSFSSNIQNPNIANVSAVNAGFYIVTVSNGTCSKTAQTNVTINSANTANVNVSSNSPICEGQNLILTASSASTYVWSGPNNFVNQQSNAIISNAQITNTGNYQVTATDGNGCIVLKDIAVLINPKPVAIATNNSPICTGNTLQLNAVGGGVYSWTGPNGFSSNLQNPSIDNVNANNAGTYQVTVSLSNCTSIASTMVSVNQGAGVTAAASSNSPICEGETIVFASLGNGTFNWTGPNGFKSNLQNPTVFQSTILSGGTYFLTVTGANGCTATAQTMIIVNNLPLVTANSNSPVCEKGTVNFVSLGGVSYKWTGPNNFTSTVQNPVLANVSLKDIGVYKVTVLDKNNCSNTATTTLVVNECTTATIESNIDNINIRPNPFSNYIAINANQNIKKIAIFNTISQNIFEQTYNDKNIIVDSEFFPSGAYFCKIYLENEKVSIFKIVKVN